MPNFRLLRQKNSKYYNTHTKKSLKFYTWLDFWELMTGCYGINDIKII
jgi:hypothetical protein